MDAPHNPAVEPILTRLDEALSNPGVEIASVFVTCLSERRDDLSQWRAYSGGEGGYAIQFDLIKLRGRSWISSVHQMARRDLRFSWCVSNMTR